MTENRAAKVEIKSKRFGEELVNEIICTTSNVVEETSELNEEERALWMNSFRELRRKKSIILKNEKVKIDTPCHFMDFLPTKTKSQIFESAFHESISVDGQAWTEVDDSSNTTEFEPIDLEKKEYINGELTNQLHNGVIEVTSKRKLCPPRYKTYLSKYLSSELCRLGSQKVVCNSKTESIQVSDDLLVSEDFLDRLQSTESTLSSTIQKSNELEKVAYLEKNKQKMTIS